MILSGSRDLLNDERARVVFELEAGFHVRMNASRHMLSGEGQEMLSEGPQALRVATDEDAFVVA